jgi:uncharacterized protein YggE
MTSCFWKICPLVFIFVICGTGSPEVFAQDQVTRRVTVQGEGILYTEPDKATVYFGVVTRGDDPETAQSENARAAKNTLNAVRDLEVPERKITMRQLRLQPVREYNPDTKQWEEKGFEVIRELEVELEDLEQLPTLITEVVQQGANRLNRVRYGLTNRGELRNEALQQAIEDAEIKARLMAETAGANLGSVLQIDEQTVDFPRPIVELQDMARSTGKDRAAPEPEAYAAGEIEVRAVVQVVYALR